MALTSPGVEVTIIDQSQYLPAPTNSVPLVVIATAQNKANPAGTGVALGTTAANAGKLYQMTSQKDLADFYGIPFFYTTTNGTPIQGYELNEYGLLAAYSLLGTTNRCYVLRADIDLSSLVGQTGRPAGAPSNGTYWLDTTTSSWGIFEFNATTGTFTEKNPIVISDTAYLSSGFPLQSIGNIGDYCINATIQPVQVSGYSQYFYKTPNNIWVIVGSTGWQNSWPTVQATTSNPTLTAGDTFIISMSGLFNSTITVPVSPNNTAQGVANAINALGYTYITATVVSGKLRLLSAQPDGGGQQYLELTNDSGTALSDLGIATGIYNQVAYVYGTSAEMPLWTSSQSQPHPTGSLWIKVGSAGLGINPVVSRYNSVTASWQVLNVALATSDWDATSMLDATGGQAIPVGEVYGQYDYDGLYNTKTTPTYLWERVALGPTAATGTTTHWTINLNFGLSSASLYVQTSIPNSASLSSQYIVTIPDNCTPTQFVTAWQTLAIPYTSALVTTDGAVQLIHTEGGEIIMDDIIETAGVNQGYSAGILSAAGFVPFTTEYCKYGPALGETFVVAPNTTSGTGINCTITVTQDAFKVYVLNGSGVSAPGTGYAVGDTLTILGTKLGGTSPANDLVLRVAAIGSAGVINAVTFVSGVASSDYAIQLSNWGNLYYTPNEGAPTVAPLNGTNWYWSVVDQVDIMVNYNGQWNGYKNLNYDSAGFPTNTGANATNSTGPIISASEPTTQTDGTALVYGDLWINTSDLENYPIISRWQYNTTSLQDMWVTLDTADQTSSKGVVFADARWAPNGDTNPVNDPIPSITSLLVSDYLDLDAPSSVLYPSGMLLFNTRRSGYNVKEYQANYFNATNFPGAASYPTVTATWLSVSGLQANGSPYMGRQAQRAMVVKSLRSVIDTNTDIRDEDNFFNLMATPYYPELQPNMVVLNADRGETAYIIGDTPMRLPDNATAIQAWATNAAGATSTGEQGCVTRNTYLGLFYPSGLTSDLSGNIVAVPPSHMMLRTFLRNDTVSYPWLAAAGTRRGNIDNATNIGYLDAATGEFITIKTRLGIRDVLYINFINPLVFFTGVGLLNYGNKTSFNSASALDRTNVARLIAYIRRQLTLATRPFVFEPNDALTRNQVAGVVQTLLVDLVAKRGLYDYLVICDESNNTPARIDRNELWIDVAVEPVKAAEFIYIPVRVLNTGEIATLK